MQNENEQATAGGDGRGGRSSVERLPSAVRDAVAAAIEDGATIDEVTAGIRALGGDAHAEQAQNTCPAKSHGVPENPGS